MYGIPSDTYAVPIFHEIEANKFRKILNTLSEILKNSIFRQVTNAQIDVKVQVQKDLPE